MAKKLREGAEAVSFDHPLINEVVSYEPGETIKPEHEILIHKDLLEDA